MICKKCHEDLPDFALGMCEECVCKERVNECSDIIEGNLLTNGWIEFEDTFKLTHNVINSIIEAITVKYALDEGVLQPIGKFYPEYGAKYAIYIPGKMEPENVYKKLKNA